MSQKGCGTMNSSSVMATDSRLERLAAMLAEQYAASCSGPTWRGSQGEKELRGVSREELMGRGFSASRAATMVVDLATTAYVDLPEHWQEANRIAARDLLQVLEDCGEDEIRAADLTDGMVRQKYGDIIHANWLAHNEWAKGGELDVPFCDLPVVEQDKDIDQMSMLQKLLG